MSQDPGPWENQTANQESQQEKEAAFEQKWAEKERKWAEMKAEVEAKHQKTSNQQQTSNQQGAWAHWEYTPEEWAQFDRLDWGPPVRRYWLRAGLGILGFPASIALFLWVILNVANAVSIIAFIAIIPVLTLMVFLVIPGRAFRVVRQRHQARQNLSQPRPQKVTLADTGIWIAGVSFLLDGPSHVEGRDDKMTLREVRLSTQPTILHMRVEYQLRSASTLAAGAYVVEEIISLLVPAGHESEAEQIAHRYRKVIEAREQELAMRRAEQETRAHPPEPI